MILTIIRQVCFFPSDPRKNDSAKMTLIQKTIFVICIASIYAASIPNMSEEDFSSEIEEALFKNSDSNMEKNEGQITEHDPVSPSFIVSDQSNGFQVGKSLIETMLGLFQIVRHMDLSPEGLKNVSFLVARLLSMFAGRYLETLKNLMPLFSGIAMAILEALG